MALIKAFKPTKFAAMFDLFDADYEQLDEIGVKVEVKATSFSVLGPQGQNIVGNIGLNKGAVSMAQAGDLPDIAKAPVKAAISSAFVHAMKSDNWQKSEMVAGAGIDFIDEVFKDMAEISKGVGAGEMFGSDPAAEEATELTSFKDINIEANPDPIDVYKAQQAGLAKSKVKLKDAEALYQPVGSTGSESIYHCVGLTISGLKFAARRSDQSLSIRVEGPVETFAPALIAAGFNEDYIKKGYTSVHFHGIDDLMAQRALGAIMSGASQTFITPMPDLEVIAGKGV